MDHQSIPKLPASSISLLVTTALCIVTLISFSVSSSIAGGSARYGLVQDGKYFVKIHGSTDLKEVPPTTWYWNYGLNIATLFACPLLLVCAVGFSKDRHIKAWIEYSAPTN